MKLNKCKDCISDKCESKILIEKINRDISKEIITRHCGLFKPSKLSKFNNIKKRNIIILE